MVHLQQRYLSPAGYLSTIIASPATAVSGLETWSDSASEETYLFYFPSQRFRRAPDPSNPVSEQLSNTLQQDLYTRLPSRAPPDLPPAGPMYEIFNNVFLDLYHPQWNISQLLFPAALISRLKTWSDSASEESKLSSFSCSSRVSTRFIPEQKSEIPKQSIRIFFKMDMF